MAERRYHAIVVADTGFGEFIEQAHTKATELFPYVSPISPPAHEGVRSFFVPPDGANEGLPASDEADARRAEFIQWLNETRYEDGSSPLAWVEVQFMDDEADPKLLRHSDQVRASDDYSGPVTVTPRTGRRNDA